MKLPPQNQSATFESGFLAGQDTDPIWHSTCAALNNALQPPRDWVCIYAKLISIFAEAAGEPHL